MRDQKLWTWHLLAAVALVLLLGMHMTIMHLGGGASEPGAKAIAWVNVAARAKTIFFTVSYIALLAAGLFHGLYGLRNILFELSPKPGIKGTINFVLAVLGLGLFVFGTWTAIVSHALVKNI